MTHSVGLLVPNKPQLALPQMSTVSIFSSYFVEFSPKKDIWHQFAIFGN